MAETDSAWDLCNCTKVRRASRRLSRIYEDALEASGVKSTQWAILIALCDQGSQTLSDCAEKLTMDRATLTHNLRPLERDGLIEIVADSADRRVKRADITDAGMQRVRLGRDGWARAQERVETALGAKDAAELRRLLDRLIEMPLAR